jgi:uncharacterized protein
MKTGRRNALKIGAVVLTGFILLNVVVYFHAYKFTHFADAAVRKTNSPAKLSWQGKLKALLTGVDNPRPANKQEPRRPYRTVIIKSSYSIACWEIQVPDPKGTVAIFHGYSGNKGSMLDKAEVFNQLGYNAILADFMGSGGSEGNETTIGFYEAKQVASLVSYMQQKGEKRIILFGTSMGAAAIMKAMADDKLQVTSAILECPFSTMLSTVEARFRAMNVPAFPMAQLLVFWGGVQNGFNAFKHNPEQYAKRITVPVLLLYGAKDRDVSRKETDAIFKNLHGPKRLRIFENAGHENYLLRHRAEWVESVSGFLK